MTMAYAKAAREIFLMDLVLVTVGGQSSQYSFTHQEATQD